MKSNEILYQAYIIQRIQFLKKVLSYNDESDSFSGFHIHWNNASISNINFNGLEFADIIHKIPDLKNALSDTIIQCFENELKWCLEEAKKHNIELE